MAILSLKRGVRARGMQPEIVLAITVAYSIFASHGFGTTVTSLVDGTHSRTSLHYAGSAVDLRTRHLPDRSIAMAIRDGISEALGADYDVLLEIDHIHIEFQPKHV